MVLIPGRSGRQGATEAPQKAGAGLGAAPEGSDAAYYDPAGFQKMGPVQDGDWLDRFEEPGQTFARYEASSPPRPEARRRTLVIQPLGPFTPEDLALVQKAADFARIYFQCPVRINETAPLPRKGRRERSIPGGRTWTQYQTRWIFLGQLFPRLPEDALAFLGVTTQDIYPDEKWNFVFGEAFLEKRVGLYSLARYLPAFRGERETPRTRTLALLRTFKVLAHETAHMFGLKHCIDYRCVVNGSNSLGEADRQPLHLCPVDLRKLQWNLGFDLTRRYRQLHAFYRSHGQSRQAAFVAGRLKRAGK